MNASPLAPLRTASCTLAVLALAVSCTSTSRPVSDLTVPARWQSRNAKQGALDPAKLAQWWTRFKDPTLNRLIADGLKASPDIRTALAKIEESRARRGGEISNLFPSLEAGFNGQGNRQETRSSGLVTTSESYSASLDASWEVDLFGKQRQQVKAATAELEEAAENYYSAQVSLASEIADAYVTLRVAEAQLDVYERNVKAREETSDITRWKEQAGEGSALDSEQSKSTLEQARATVPQLKQSMEQTRNRLALLTGRTPGSLNAQLSKTGSIPLPPTMLATGIPADTLRQRPDVRAAERALEAAAARTRSAEREQLPSLTLSGSIGLDALSSGTIFSPQTAVANAAGQLAAPIFNAGRIRQNIRTQSAIELQALIAWEKSVLTALSEVEDALIAVQRSTERLRILDKAVTAAREAEKLAAASYQAGQIDLLQVLEAQRTLLSLEEQQAVARGNQTSAHISLYKSLGGGWSH